MHHFFRYHQFIPFLKFYLSTFLMIATKKIIFSIINIKFQKKVNFPFSISSLAVLHSPFFTRNSSLSIVHSLFSNLHSLFSILHSSFPFSHFPISTIHSTFLLLVTSVYRPPRKNPLKNLYSGRNKFSIWLGETTDHKRDRKSRGVFVSTFWPKRKARIPLVKQYLL